MQIDEILHASMHVIKFNTLIRKHTITDSLSMVPCSDIIGTAEVSFVRSMMAKAKIDGTLTDLTDIVRL